ncbi:MAG: hypothetical protein ACTSWY_14255 [Promethearchaeota archaeon]
MIGKKKEISILLNTVLRTKSMAFRLSTLVTLKNKEKLLIEFNFCINRLGKKVVKIAVFNKKLKEKKN